MERTEVIERLEGGLVLRRATASDVEGLVEFNAAVHGAPGRPDPSIGIWTRDLLTRPHPTFAAGGFLVVEDPGAGRIVSSLNLIPQTWSYGGVPFGVGRVELVGTLPEYRRRGLVRRQMVEVHRWSAALEHPVQIITGISNFYRQFGYEQGLAMHEARLGYRHHIPALPPGAAEPFRVRPATPADAGFLAGLEAVARQRSLLAVPRDAALWRFELEGMSEGSEGRRHALVVEAAAGAPRPVGERVGYLVHGSSRAPMVTLTAYEVVPGLSWLAVTPSVLRALEAFGDASSAARPEDAGRRLERFRFQLGAAHPVYDALPERLPQAERPYPNYVRVPDLPAFLRLVAPVLERRLAESVAVGHTGDLRLSFYRDGVRLRFREGRLLGAEPCPHHAPNEDAGPIGARFPDRTFLQLLVGSRSLAELEDAFGDCRVTGEEARVLLRTLFPKRPSLIWPID
jgi:GNAT superfamily N-acetyltransferase